MKKVLNIDISEIVCKLNNFEITDDYITNSNPAVWLDNQTYR